MNTAELFECEKAVTIREIAAEASRLTGVAVRPETVRRIRRRLSALHYARRIDEIDGTHNPWNPNGHIANSGRVGPSYTFNDFRAMRLLRAVVAHVQNQFQPDFAVVAQSPFGCF